MTSEARLLANILVIGLGEGGALVACVFACIKGRPAERYGGALYLASVLGTLAFYLITRQGLSSFVQLGLDALVAVGFLWLAIRYNSLWLGAAMMIKGVQLALYGLHLTDMIDPKFGGANLYLLAMDVIAIMISLTLFLGTLSGLRERRRARQAQAFEGPALSGAAPG